MARYVVFHRRDRPLPLDKVMGYLERLTDEWILGSIEYGVKQNSHVLWFSEDGRTRVSRREVSTQEASTLVGGMVLNGADVSKQCARLCSRYNLKMKLYHE